MSSKSVLAFLAHPDDAEILCAGTLIRLSALGWEIHIATGTAGDCGTTHLDPEEISSIRLREAQASAGLINAYYHCAGFRDGLIAYSPDSLRTVYELFRRINPTLVFTHPRRDYMMDHEQVHALARAASFLSGARNISRLAPPAEFHVPHLYYCDPIGGCDELGRPVRPTTYIDITSTQELKLRMLACHESQREWLRHHHGMDEYLDAVRRHDSERGGEVGRPAAEAFVQHRGHAYPPDDLLASLFPM
jgi:LmbE family N-acetylglucosaminyl deacetylase